MMMWREFWLFVTKWRGLSFGLSELGASDGTMWKLATSYSNVPDLRNTRLDGWFYSWPGSSRCATLDKSTWAYKAVIAIEDCLAACWPRHNGTKRNHCVTPRQSALRTAYTDGTLDVRCVRWYVFSKTAVKWNQCLGFGIPSIWNFCTGVQTHSCTEFRSGMTSWFERCSLGRQAWQRRSAKNVTLCNGVHGVNRHMYCIRKSTDLMSRS
jgi:hypothetical protein